MIAAAALVFALAGAVPVRDAGVRVTPPAAWTESPDTARAAAAGLGAEAGTLGEGVTTGGRAWIADAKAPRKAVLHVQWLIGKSVVPEAERGARVRDVLDDARERPRLAALPTTAFELIAWEESVGERVASASIEHRHLDHGTHTLGRTLVFVDAGGRVRELRAECLWAESGGSDSAGPRAAGAPDAGAADEATRATCAAALASLEPLAPAQLQALGDVPGQIALRVTDPGSGPVPDDDDDEPGAGARADGGLELRTPSIGESVAGAGDHIRRPPGAGAAGDARPGQDRPMSRLLLVGGGLAVIVALALTMGKKRS